MRRKTPRIFSGSVAVAVLFGGGCGAPPAVLEPGAADDAQVYFLPFAAGTSRFVAQGSFGVFGVGSHAGQYAIDFVMPENTPVLAARAGIVVEARADCPNENCPFDPESCCGNFIRIRHEDGTTAAYFHLVEGGSCVAEGDIIQRGDIIGRSGNTGRSLGPHLHFSVSAPPREIGTGRFGPSDNRTMEVRFADVPGDGVPETWNCYASANEVERDFCAPSQE